MLALLAGLALASAPKGTVVLIHGAGGGGWEYDLWRPVFEKQGWRVINRDLVPVKGGYAKTRFSDYVDQVVSWTPKKGRVILIGASMGGILALRAAERVKPSAVVLVNAAPPKGIGPERKSDKSPDVVKWANGPLKDTEDAMPDSDRKTILWAWPKWRDESGAVMNEIRAGVEAKPPACPVLVVLGQKDTDIPNESGYAMAKWAKADVFSYQGMSHVGPLMSRRSSEVALAISLWLDSRK